MLARSAVILLVLSVVLAGIPVGATAQASPAWAVETAAALDGMAARYDAVVDAGRAPVAGRLANERVALIVTDASGASATFGFVTDDQGRLVEVREGAPSDPTLRVRATYDTVQYLTAAENPAAALSSVLLRVDEGRVADVAAANGWAVADGGVELRDGSAARLVLGVDEAGFRDYDGVAVAALTPEGRWVVHEVCPDREACEAAGSVSLSALAERGLVEPGLLTGGVGVGKTKHDTSKNAINNVRALAPPTGDCDDTDEDARPWAFGTFRCTDAGREVTLDLTADAPTSGGGAGGAGGSVYVIADARGFVPGIEAGGPAGDGVPAGGAWLLSVNEEGTEEQPDGPWGDTTRLVVKEEGVEEEAGERPERSSGGPLYTESGNEATSPLYEGTSCGPPACGSDNPPVLYDPPTDERSAGGAAGLATGHVAVAAPAIDAVQVSGVGLVDGIKWALFGALARLAAFFGL